MPVDTTWGIMPPSARDRPQVDLEQWSFLERIFNKTKLQERTWAQLVTLDTLNWYCDGPEPSSAARQYDNRVRKQMDAARRRALIKQQAAKKKQDGGQAKGTTHTVPSKRIQHEKADRPPKKQRTTVEPVVALQAEKTPVKHGKGKGLMKGPTPSGEKPPVLFREDSSYALEKMSSMLTADDYADLGNHSTEAMGETGLFTLAQAMVMMKGLFGRCLNHETSMDRLRQKNKTMEEELHELKTYKINMDRKLKCSEQVRGEVEKENGHLRELLNNKDKQLTETMSKLDNAKEIAVQEYRDSENLITELGNSFADGFDDAIRQVKSSYPELDLSHINIDAQGQTIAQSVQSESTDEVLAVTAPADEGEVQPPAQQDDGPLDGNSSPKNE
ncbi:uncharacterized protein LOC142606444 [Castanea sativa]|uniref:uncharacterized protein LOC142606444 n=1 Tax=Castanea sativa TaxID=21020 RepID=UPI003F64C4F1